jgi:hypothetical protein
MGSTESNQHAHIHTSTQTETILKNCTVNGYKWSPQVNRQFNFFFTNSTLLYYFCNLKTGEKTFCAQGGNNQ